MRPLLPLFMLSAFFFSSGCEIRLKDFDVSSQGVLDPNGFPLNPRWGKQVKDNTLPDVHAVCPIDVVGSWNDDLRFPNCTHVSVSYNRGGLPCAFHADPGHVNFMTVTYEGTATWGGKSAWDDDYEIDVRRDEDFALYNTNSSGRVHTEFNSEETVDNWDDTGTWWENLHRTWAQCGWLLDWEKCPKRDVGVRRLLNGKRVIVIGLLNLDNEHNGKTELHPVYAMFVSLPPADPLQTSWTSWAFFVRNWGDQGFCGDDDKKLPTSWAVSPNPNNIHPIKSKYRMYCVFCQRMSGSGREMKTTSIQ